MRPLPIARSLRQRLRRGPAPVSAALYVTQRCNLRCGYCSSPLRRIPELTTAQWVEVVDGLARLGCARIGILGGEPLLRPDVGEIVDAVRARRMSCVLTSNGLLVPERIGSLRSLDTLVLSLDAPGPENDVLRGKGVHAAVREAMRAARGAGIPVKLNAVLSEATAPRLEDLVAFAESEGVGLTVNLMRFGNPALWNRAAQHRSPDGEMRRWLLRLADLARERRVMLFSPATYEYAAAWGDFSRDRLEGGEVEPGDPRATRGPRCHAGRRSLAIDADGTAYPCALTMDSLPGGNVLADGVGPVLGRLSGHPCVACWSPCMVEQNFLQSGKPAVMAHFLRRHLPRYA